MKKGDKIRRLVDGKIFTFDRKCEIGFGNIYVQELCDYVYSCDFEVAKEDEEEYKNMLKELKAYKQGFNDLKEALRFYIEKQKKVIKTTDNKDLKISCRGQLHAYQWILNSIGHHSFILHERHATNITNHLYRSLEFYDDKE